MKIILSSSSKGRQDLMAQAGIECIVIPHTYNEDLTPPRKNELLRDYVMYIIQKKRTHINQREILQVPGDEFCVINADTMTFKHNTIYGKPAHMEQAYQWLINTIIKDGVDIQARVISAFDVTVYQRHQNTLKEIAHHTESVETSIRYGFFDQKDVDEYYHYYGEKLLNIAGGFTVTGMGQQYIREIQGSYTNIIGLPMFELRAALKLLKVM